MRCLRSLRSSRCLAVALTFVLATVAVARQTPEPTPTAEQTAQTAPTESTESTGDDQPVVPIPASTMSELMIRVIYPASDAVLYAGSRTPETEAEWNELQTQALLVAETANLLLAPERALDDGQWMKDTKLMLDAGIAAYEAALAKDIDKLIELNEPLYQSCVVCHLHYRPDYLKDARLKLEDPPP